MKVRVVIVAMLAALAAACTTAPPLPRGTAQGICPMQAIERAAAAAPHGVRGRYTLRVRRVGHADGLVYLDSQRDYRDQRNVSVVLYPQAQAQLRARFDGSLSRTLQGQRIAVTGVARRVKIVFLDSHHRATGKYYYQTHIAVIRGRQLEQLPAAAAGPAAVTASRR